MRRLSTTIAIAFGLAAAIAAPAEARDWHDHHGYHHGGWHGDRGRHDHGWHHRYDRHRGWHGDHRYHRGHDWHHHGRHW